MAFHWTIVKIVVLFVLIVVFFVLMSIDWTMSWLSRIFSSASQKAEKQGHDLSKEVKGQSDLVQEIFANKAEKQGHKLIEEGEGIDSRLSS